MKSQFITVSGVLLAAAIAVIPVIRLKAEADPTSVEFRPLVFSGFQADSSSPLLLQGEPIGKDAIWHVLTGPISSPTVAVIPGAPAPSSFGGAACKADYSEAEIITKDGKGTLTLNVYGFRCEPHFPPTAYYKTGVYFITGGTGEFQNVQGGTGSLLFAAPPHGVVFVVADGVLVMPKKM